MLNKLDIYIGKLDYKKFLFLFFFITSFGLFKLALYFTSLINLSSYFAFELYGLSAWAKVSGVSGKVDSFLIFYTALLGMFLYYTIFFSLLYLTKKKLLSFNNFSKAKKKFFLILAVLANVLIALIPNSLGLIIHLLIFIFWSVIFFVFFNAFFNIKISSKLFPQKAQIFLILILCFQFFLIFFPLITKPIYIANDYLNIPEQTHLESGQVVDNLNYINKNNISGYEIYDPRTEITEIKPNRSSQAAAEFYQNNQNKLETLRPYSQQEGEVFRPEAKHIYSKENIDFIEKNNIEMKHQQAAGHFFYHHNFFFGPMHATFLGANPTSQTLIYGWLNTMTIKNILSSLNMLTYEGYFKIFFIGYIVYFLLFLVGIWLIFRRYDLVAFSAIFFISSIYLLGIEYIELAPGFNPLRHIFDVPVFFFLFNYARNKNYLYFFLASSLALFSILWSRDFGLFLSLSVALATLFVKVPNLLKFNLRLPISVFTFFFRILTLFLPLPGPGTYW